MRILFVTAWGIESASTRFRAAWPAKYMEADLILYKDFEQQWKDINADAFIFVKIGKPEIMQALRERGKQVWWDVCDPMWWWEPQKSRLIADTVTGIVASNKALADDFNEWYGRSICRTIPDRLELSHYPLKREHVRTSPIRFIWYGAGQNRFAVLGGLANLERLAANGYQVALTIMDDQPGNEWQVTDIPVYHVRWSLDKENEIIASHDVALLPPYPGPWGHVKSDNKVLTAWACGLPVANGMDYYGEMERLMDYTMRRRKCIPETNLELFDVRLSAQSWQELLGHV